MKICRILLLAIFSAGLGLVVPSASSVLAVSLEQLSKSAKIVFEGEVIGIRSNFNDNQTAIYTHVTFLVVDVVKGDYVQKEITLRFLGGTVGEISLDVSDSTLPILGEKGIYFVESMDRYQVNPLYGMDQGHFLILESNGQRIMVTRNKRVVTGLSSASRATSEGLSNGVATGLTLAEAGTSPAGVTVLQFTQAVRQYSGELQ